MKDKTAELLKMYELVDQAEQVLVNKDADLDDFGRLLDYTWQLKRGISSGISSDSIDDQYNRAMKAGALGGKLLGAGGGGFLLFYVPKEKQDAVRESLKIPGGMWMVRSSKTATLPRGHALPSGTPTTW